MTIRPEIHSRFRAIVARATVRAEEEYRAHLARLKALPEAPDEDGMPASRRRQYAQRGGIVRGRRRPAIGDASRGKNPQIGPAVGDAPSVKKHEVGWP